MTKNNAADSEKGIHINRLRSPMAVQRPCRQRGSKCKSLKKVFIPKGSEPLTHRASKVPQSQMKGSIVVVVVVVVVLVVNLTS